MFLLPPNSPADSAFEYLNSVARQRSDSARAKAQGEVDAFTKRKLAEIQELDRTLRREVNLLWSNWHDLASHQYEDRTLDELDSRAPQTPKSPSPSHRPDTRVTIRDNFDNIARPPLSNSHVAQEDRQPTPTAPMYGSLLTNSRSSVPDEIANSLYQPPSRSRSPRQAPERLGSSDASRYDTTAQHHGASTSGSRSPMPVNDDSGRRLTVKSAGPLDDSRAVAASFQIMMSDNMAPARAAHLQKLGLPSTYEGDGVDEPEETLETEEAQDTIASLPSPSIPQQPRTPTRKGNSTSFKTPKSPGSAKKSVSFQHNVDSPRSASRTQSAEPPRNHERTLGENPLQSHPAAHNQLSV